MAITQTYVDYGSGNDYTGATFNDGSFANATNTLTKAGAFAAASPDHWLYLGDNGSGEVTEGYYKISSVTDNDNVVLASDIRSGANDPTDVTCTQADGSSGTPFRSIQGALDLITQDTTDGDQINVQSGTAQVLQASLNLDEYGTPGAAYPLILRGYTSSANDGGTGEIDCNGNTMWAATTYDYLILIDLTLHNFGDNDGVVLDNYCMMYRCTVYKGVSSPSSKTLVYIDSSSAVIGSYIYDPGGGLSSTHCVEGSGMVAYNYLDMGAGGSSGYCASVVGSFIGNIMVCRATGQRALTVPSGGGHMILGNSLYNTAAGTSYALYIQTVAETTLVGNNIIVGWSGVGGSGIFGNGDICWVGYNAFYNCTTKVSISDQTFVDETGNDVSLAADPFTDAANGDFSLTDIAKAALRSAGWPESYLGAHANTDPHITIGALQDHATINRLRGKLG